MSENAEALLAKYDATDVTVWYVPRLTAGARSQVSTIHPSLRAAVEAIRDDGVRHLAYDVHIHEQPADKILNESELRELLAAVKKSG